MSAQNSASTPSFWNFGSRPDSSGATYRPVASHAVAIQKMPICVWMVRLTAYGRTLRQRQAKERLPFDRVVRGDDAHADLQQHRGR